MGNSSSQIVNDVINSVSSQVVNTINSASNINNINQEIKAICKDPNATRQCLNDCQKICVDHKFKSDSEFNKCLNNCQICNQCKISDVDMKQTAYFSSTITNIADVSASLVNSLNKQLSQLTDDSDANQEINSETNIENLTNINNALKSELRQNSTQVIDVKNYVVNSVNMEQTIKSIQNIKLQNKTVGQLTSDIVDKVSQKSLNNMKILGIVAVIIVLIFLGIFGIIAFQKSPDAKSFFYKLLPYFIFIFICFIITIIHIYAKPSYIMVKDVLDENKKSFDYTKLILLLITYYIITGIIIFIPFYFINRKRKTKNINSNIINRENKN